jgi:putative transposase
VVGSQAQRKAVSFLIQTHSLSERRACELSQAARSTYRYMWIKTDDKLLRKRLKLLAYRRKSFGYRRLHALLKKEGFAANHKKVYRLYKEEGLSKRKKPRKRYLKRTKEPLRAAERPNQKWAMDFMSDSFGSSRKLRTLNILDVCTRECPSIEVNTSLPAAIVIRVLNRLGEDRGFPEVITVDNGPEYTSNELREWAEEHGVILEYISPGKPTENGYIESFNGKFREECLNQNWFRNLSEARLIIEEWRQDYNERRPHSSLGYKTPEEYAREVNTKRTMKSLV